MTKKNTKSDTQSKSTGWSGTVRDVSITAMSKGYFVLLFLGAIHAFQLWMLPESERLKFLYDIGNSLKDNTVTGWAVSFSLTFGWFSIQEKFEKPTKRKLTD